MSPMQLSTQKPLVPGLVRQLISGPTGGERSHPMTPLSKDSVDLLGCIGCYEPDYSTHRVRMVPVR